MLNRYYTDLNELLNDKNEEDILHSFTILSKLKLNMGIPSKINNFLDYVDVEETNLITNMLELPLNPKRLKYMYQIRNKQKVSYMILGSNSDININKIKTIILYVSYLYDKLEYNEDEYIKLTLELLDYNKDKGIISIICTRNVKSGSETIAGVI